MKLVCLSIFAFLLFGKERRVWLRQTVARNEQGALPLDPAALPTAFQEPSGFFFSGKQNAEGT